MWLRLSLVLLLTRGKEEISGGQVLDKAGEPFFRAVTGARRIDHVPVMKKYLSVKLFGRKKKEGKEKRRERGRKYKKNKVGSKFCV